MEKLLNIEDKRAFAEVLDVLKYMSISEVGQIPVEFMRLLEAHADPNYDYTLDTNRTFAENELSETAKAILSYMYINFWITSAEKKKVENINQTRRYKKAEEARSQYSPDHIFDHRKEKKQQEEREIEEVRMVEYRENIFAKIRVNLRRLFRKRV